MKWPWGTQFTDQQAEETAKYLLNLSQAAMIGAVGIAFAIQLDFIVRILLSMLGFILGVFLYLFSMRLLKEVKAP